MSERLWIVTVFGLESVTADEVKRMGFQNVAVETGRVLCDGELTDLPKLNMGLRTAERVLVSVGECPARTFTELFDGVKAMPWEKYLPEDAAFPVTGHANRSALFSVSDCQSIVKKAVVERLKKAYPVDWFGETGAKYAIKFSILNDVARLAIDSTGESLHKRGYRKSSGEAPMSETLAAGLVLLSRYRGYETLHDPMCGSGTIPIEAALIAQNRAPGLYRTFDCSMWTHFITKRVWDDTRAAFKAAERLLPVHIIGGDIDQAVVEVARGNAALAGLGTLIEFRHEDLRDAEFSPGVMIANPPYGERISDPAGAMRLIRMLGEKTKNVPELRRYVISPDEDFEKQFGSFATKRRKLYNGMIKCNYYMFLPPKPKK